MSVELSIVIPVYQAEGCLETLHERLTATLNGMGISYEIVLVDDGSRDGSWQKLVTIAAKDSNVHAYRLSRNFGQHAAISAGIEQCRGEWAIVMDCDLQDPPEEIARLYGKAKEGFDVVLARRAEKKTSFFRRFFSRMYFSLLNRIVGEPIDGDHGSFSCISRKVINAYLKMHDHNRHYLFILRWLGFPYASIEYVQAERHSGKSAYTFRALLRHAVQGVFFQTTTVLYWIIYAGFAASGIAMLVAVYFIAKYFLYDIQPGWTSLSVLILGMGGVILVCIGMVGLYVAQIFEQVKDRPLYVIAQKA